MPAHVSKGWREDKAPHVCSATRLGTSDIDEHRLPDISRGCHSLAERGFEGGEVGAAAGLREAVDGGVEHPRQLRRTAERGHATLRRPDVRHASSVRCQASLRVLAQVALWSPVTTLRTLSSYL